MGTTKKPKVLTTKKVTLEVIITTKGEASSVEDTEAVIPKRTTPNPRTTKITQVKTKKVTLEDIMTTKGDISNIEETEAVVPKKTTPATLTAFTTRKKTASATTKLPAASTVGRTTPTIPPGI